MFSVSSGAHPLMEATEMLAEQNVPVPPVARNSSSSQIHIHHHHHYHRRNASDGGPSQVMLNASSKSLQTYRSIKLLTLNNLDSKQHFFIAICRDVSLLPPLLSFAHSLKKAWSLSYKTSAALYPLEDSSVSLSATFKMMWQAYKVSKTQAFSADTNLPLQLSKARSSEYLLCSLWCLVAMYLTYSILEALMVRWIVKYSTAAAILRMFSMSLLLITLEMLLLSSLSPKGDYYLHTWILISCILTGAYISQSFLTSNFDYLEGKDKDFTDAATRNPTTNSQPTESMDTACSSPSSEDLLTMPSRKRKKSSNALLFHGKRQMHLYNITVFCVVPVGVASFVTMIGLLRNLVIQRLDVEQLEAIIEAAL
ncbi:LAMI_0C10418g1_1 [Lachancea mirantina]|uniref:LAMI_0C10418g1_1 n=1 Tax=Lachancea mirantina TaxID=1230905 RepID=A0A1G4J5T2_9SACH|nr:LAMI_0C10418g1_1 [Lachancea mirantina]